MQLSVAEPAAAARLRFAQPLRGRPINALVKGETVRLIKKLRDGFAEGLRKANPDASDSALNEIIGTLEDKIRQEPPPRIAIVGEAGVGKSTTINALFNAGVEVSDTRACTKRDIELAIELSEDPREPKQILVYDMPGLGESIQADRKNIKIYENVLPRVDIFVWILDAQNRAIRSVQERLLNDLSPRVPGAIGKLVLALNKVDLVAPGQDAWNPEFNVPGESQMRNINAREADVREKILEVLPSWRGATVAYSAIKRFRLPSLFKMMLEAVPEERRWVLGDRMDLASFESLVSKGVLRAIKQVDRRDDGFEHVRSAAE